LAGIELLCHIFATPRGGPDFAQAGGKEPEKLPAALAAVQEAVREQLAR